MADSEVPQSGPSTACVHAGEQRKKHAGALTNPIVQSSTFVYDNMAEVEDYAARKLQGEITRYEYTRYGNPTERPAAMKLAELEGGEAARLFATGMNAVTTCLLTFVKSGSHIVITEEAYKKTASFVERFLSRFGVAYTFVSPEDYRGLEAALRPNTAVAFSESPTNPHLSVVDLPKWVEIVKSKSKAVTVIDATFATPINQRPLAFGVDLVVHSCTKYLAGHNDLLAGVVVGSTALVDRVEETLGTLGGNIDPHCAYLLLRGLKTLALRMERHNANGQVVAEFLEAHPKVRKVYYPGLPSHPHHEIARSQMRGFGGVVSFEIEGDKEATFRFIDAVRVPYLGPSLGGVESLIYHPAALTFADISPEERDALGLVDQLVRLSVGIEDVEDITRDLDRALGAV